MKILFKIIFISLLLLLTFFITTVKAEDYDSEGNIIPDTEVNSLFVFPDVGVGTAFDLNQFRLVSTLNIEILDTDDSPNIIPLKIEKMPKLIDVVGDVGVGDGLVLLGVGVRFLPILEPGVLVWGGYNFNDGCEAYGVSIRFGIKF